MNSAIKYLSYIFTGVFLLFFITFTVQAQTVFINEIHYDNDGADVDEGVEIAGPAGTDLSCYDIVPYNGSNGEFYSSTSLSGTIDDEGCGYGAVWFAISGLQNGAPDGIALYNTCTSTLIQFLSYEGSFTATNGIASGSTSTDIGVSESGSEAAGNSIQLTGTGTTYTDFSWASATTASTGTINSGQDFCSSSVSITTDLLTPGSPYSVDCTTSDNVDVDFSGTGVFNSGNVFTAQLSDAIGDFTSAVDIGTLTLSGTDPSGTISAAIPAGTLSGTGYRIRIVSDNPSATGSDNGTDLTITNTTTAGTVIINEVSNGTSGNQEYFELLVVGTSCSEVNIAGILIDDNNGDFSGGPTTGAGIANGHLRFSDVSQWRCTPTGSIIVIYNEDEKNTAIPADDESDSNVDSVFILAADNSTFLEYCTSTPTSSDDSYSPCTYSSPGDYNSLIIANGGDAAQVRNTDATYMHGIAYGGSPMTGGPDNLLIGTANGGGNNFYFDNSTSNNYADVNNWTRGTAGTDETPGAPNNVANNSYIKSFRCSTLPVELLFFEAFYNQQRDIITLNWQTVSETDNDYFTIQKSYDGRSFYTVKKVDGAGYSASVLNYSTIDKEEKRGTIYYRLQQTDFDGNYSYSAVVPVEIKSNSLEIDYIFSSPNVINIIYSGKTSNRAMRLEIIDITGKVVFTGRVTDENKITLNNLSLAEGVYSVRLSNEYEIAYKKFFYNRSY